MIISINGPKNQKEAFKKEFDKNYHSFMYVYDPETSIGQIWLDIMLSLYRTGNYKMSEYDVETFSEALDNLSGIIGGEFDLDLEYIN